MRKNDGKELQRPQTGFLKPDGSEVLDSTPMEIPVGFERPESIQELIRRLVIDPQIRQDLQDHGAESFEEADDFEMDDDMPRSPHEDQFDPMHLLAREQEVMSGAVKALTPGEVAAAKAAVEAYRAAQVKGNAPAAAAAPDVPGKAA